MRLAYFGTSEHAAAVLRTLASGPFRPALVITPVDRPKGRGRRLSPPPVAELASELGLPLHQSENVNRDDTAARIGEAGADLGLVCAFGQLIGDELLAAIEMLNVHPSLLPRWRGAAPIERAIMAGDGQTGVSIIRLVAALDAGPVALQEALAIEPGENFGSLDCRLSELGGRLALEALELREAEQLSFAEQDEAGVTYAEKIDRSERLLNPALAAGALELVVRGLTPHVGAQLALEGGDRLGVREAAATDGGPVQGVLEAAPEGEALLLGCGEGSLRITRVLPPGGREMSASDYLRGREIPRPAGPGD